MMSEPLILTFDIETIPDVAGTRRLHNLPATLSDAEVVDIMQRLLRQKKGNDFFPLHLQRVATISCVLRRFDNWRDMEPIKIFSLPYDADVTCEETALRQFFGLIKKHEPVLVSWNGGGFDLPVLHYRAMVHRLQAPTYWRNDDSYKWNNYTSRYHERHTDLMDVIAMFNPRAYAPLGDFAMLCDLPGKLGVGGAGVWDAWQKNDMDGIRRYCETDALLTYLLYARFQHFRGREDADAEEAFIREQLERDGDRWQEFLTAWKETPPAEQKKPADSDTLF